MAAAASRHGSGDRSGGTRQRAGDGSAARPADLKSGLSVTAAGERYCALASPELFHVVTKQLGWTAEQHRSWLAGLLRADLLS
jgi:hypothetical protein